jgi:purine-nucleoside phosphorylase
MQTTFRKRVEAAAASITAKTGIVPRLGVILGSGLSSVVDSLVSGDSSVTIPFDEIDGFPTPTVTGHRGTLALAGRTAVMAGRFHYYEHGEMDDAVLPVATLAALGIDTLIVTNAAGGLNPDYSPGDLVLIRDHINLMGTNPLIGPQDPAAFHRFQDMTTAYDPELRNQAHTIDGGLKEGVYAALTGPSYETPAEISMLATLGADLVGMSTVPEVIVARSYGVRVLGISTVTNLAAGLSGAALDHAEVVATGAAIQDRLARLMRDLIETLGN